MSSEVKRYYESNSSKFKSFGIDPSGKNVHQPLWGEGVSNKQDAVNYSNKLVLRQVLDFLTSDARKVSVLDLGCGFGATLLFLVNELKNDTQVDFFGITISEYQAREAQKNLDKKAVIVCGDFQSQSTIYSEIDFAFAIESMVHSPDLEIFLLELSKAMAAGGKMIIIDDFVDRLIREEDKKLIKDYSDNWFTHSLTSEKQFKYLSEKVGLHIEYSESLRHLIKQTLKGKIGRLAYALGLKKTSNLYLKSIVGGAARQNALLRRVLDYRILVLNKPEK